MLLGRHEFALDGFAESEGWLLKHLGRHLEKPHIFFQLVQPLMCPIWLES